MTDWLDKEKEEAGKSNKRIKISTFRNLVCNQSNWSYSKRANAWLAWHQHWRTVKLNYTFFSSRWLSGIRHSWMTNGKMKAFPSWRKHSLSGSKRFKLVGSLIVWEQELLEGSASISSHWERSSMKLNGTVSSQQWWQLYVVGGENANDWLSHWLLMTSLLDCRWINRFILTVKNAKVTQHVREQKHAKHVSCDLKLFTSLLLSSLYLQVICSFLPLLAY